MISWLLPYQSTPVAPPLRASDYHRIAQRRLYTCPVCQKDDLAKTAHYHLEQFPLLIDSQGHGSRHVDPE